MSPRTVQMLVTFILFTAVMAGVGWMLKRVVPPFVDWAGAQIGIGWFLAIVFALVAVAGLYAYRAEMAARSGRSERSF